MSSQNSTETGFFNLLTDTNQLVTSLENKLETKFNAEIEKKISVLNLKNNDGRVQDLKGGVLGGCVLQVVSRLVNKSESILPLSTIDRYVPGYAIAIVPKKLDSNILVSVRWFGEVNRAYDVVFNVHRNYDLSRVNVTDTNGGHGLSMATIVYHGNNGTTPEIMHFTTLDKRVIGRDYLSYHLTASLSTDVSGVQLYTGRTIRPSAVDSEKGVGEIILMEVASVPR